VPLCVIRHDHDRVEYLTDRGSALLITEGCQLDKRTSKTQAPKIKRLQFVPVRDYAEANLGDDLDRRLRNGDLNPAEAMRLDLGAGDEGLVFLSEAYTIPSAYFQLTSEDYTGAEGADPTDPFHVVPQEHDTRELTLDGVERRLLQEKLALFWTHMEMPPQKLPLNA
jgi:hypothetical protein